MNQQCKLLAQLKTIVGTRHVFTSRHRTERFRTGFRFGKGPALAVVRPTSLLQLWDVIVACVTSDAIIIMQAANTGLTGGSTPHGTYDRPVVIVNTLLMNSIYLIDGGAQVICLPGATLFELERVLRPLGRTPHSVIGSSCIGASVIGGVSNNSGGSLIQRGPAYTELALFARVDSAGVIRLVNHLGLDLGDEPKTMLARLDRREFSDSDVSFDPARAASDHAYRQHVRDVEANTPARFNADPSRLFEASGSAGKVITFAVRLDTFAQEHDTTVFYLGSNATAELECIRRHILTTFKSLPVSGEYIHRDAFNLAETYGKDMFLAIRHLGTARLPIVFAIKARIDSVSQRLKFLPPHLSDRLMQLAGKLFPPHLPRRMTEYRDRYEHHLLLSMSGDGVQEAREYLAAHFPTTDAAFFECTADEGAKAFLHRFAVAGAAIRYRAIHRKEVEDIVSLDVALRRNDHNWFETLPPEVRSPISHSIYYGHFFCHVFHQDYIVRKGHDPKALEHTMLKILSERGAEYPAEHNVGHLYEAKPPLAEHYRALDPCNVFNPGIGLTSKAKGWR